MGRKREKTHESPSIQAIEQSIETVIGKAEALRSAVSSLPEVDKEGQSDCDFAEELYAKKEELQEQVRAGLQELAEHLRDVTQEMQKIKGDLAVVSAHQDQLNGDRAREHFSEAEVHLAALYKRYRKLRDRLEEVIEVVREVLEEAASKRWPLGKPRTRQEIECGDTDPPERLVPSYQPEGADKELQDLIEMDAGR